MWDPAQYRRYSDERSRPFFELLARVGAAAPRYVVDLGCGPGNLTAALARRWPAAEVVGVDSSVEMLTAAEAQPRDRQHAGGGSLTFQLGDVRDFAPARPPEVIICNAVLQWIPGHRNLLPRWAGMLCPGGWLAIQVPGNHDQPSHQILRELAASPRWRESLADVITARQTDDPGDYLELLARAGCEVDAWETTYLHVLRGDDPVLEWYKGSGLRPVIAALPPNQADEFLKAYASRLRTAYPPHGYGTMLPFRRVFVVARIADR